MLIVCKLAAQWQLKREIALKFDIDVKPAPIYNFPELLIQHRNVEFRATVFCFLLEHILTLTIQGWIGFSGVSLSLCSHRLRVV